MSSKWPYHADGREIRDFDGKKVGEAASANEARLLAAAPALYLFWKAASRLIRDAAAGSMPSDRAANQLADYDRMARAALDGWRNA